ncbi:hypothetical protein GW17_00034562 [Ensete ventricosum]|nr:hypothetical protein GW17_00034562 [Ensete ventricosum]RZR91840.1 hypothetical protein BHM03_00020029 [Ensete ventricosum]
MASGDGASPSPVCHSLLYLLRSSSKPFLADWNPLISSSPPMARKKLGRFASAALRLLGCASEEASQAYAPAAASARSYSDWQRNRPQGKAKRKEERRSRDGGDVWCAPRVPFASEASVDCVVSHRRLAGSRRPEDADRTHSEVVNLSSTPHLPIRGVHQEHTSAFMDSFLELDAPLFEHDLASTGHLHNLPIYRQTPSRLQEVTS